MSRFCLRSFDNGAYAEISTADPQLLASWLAEQLNGPRFPDVTGWPSRGMLEIDPIWLPDGTRDWPCGSLAVQLSGAGIELLAGELRKAIGLNPAGESDAP